MGSLDHVSVHLQKTRMAKSETQTRFLDITLHLAALDVLFSGLAGMVSTVQQQQVLSS